jgi:hypothetical protein
VTHQASDKATAGSQIGPRSAILFLKRIAERPSLG